MGETDWSGWIGRLEHTVDRADPKPIRALAATLDAPFDPGPGEILPELSHWLYFLPVVPKSQVGPDGHPKRGDFLPPLPLERRMWAGGRVTFHAELRAGDDLERKSEILKISQKEGKTGRMAFITVKHSISSQRGLAIEEEQDLAYLEMPKTFAPPEPMPLPEGLAWQEQFTVDPVMLFRFSAITFNGHRIHYDLKYATEIEKYPGLVVHGPLQAIMLVRAAQARHADRRLLRFAFRGTRPLFDFDTFVVSGRARNGGALDLYTSNGDGHVCMQATVDWQEK